MWRRTGIAAAAVVGGAGLGIVGLAISGPAASADPPGNNGTVKVDGEVFDTDPDNEPHVDCVFEVDFYGFDEGDLQASVSFTPVAPTVGDELLADDLDIGEDAAGGGTDLDASATYDLTEALAGIEPHSEQGWHIKLTIHAEGSQGADTKFKVFWVEGCAGPEPTPTPTPTPTPPPDGTTTTTEKEHGGGRPTTTDRDDDGPSPTQPDGQPGAPGGPTGAPSTTSTDVDSLAQTGSNSSIPLTIGALVLISLGATAALWARRLRPADAGE